MPWEPGQPVEAACRSAGSWTVSTEAGSPVARVAFKGTLLSTVLDWGESLGFAVFWYVVFKSWIFQSFFVPSPSMEPNLLEGDKLFGTKYDFILREPRRGEMVIFEPPPAALRATGRGPEGARELWVKRAVAGPGDVVQVAGGVVTVNGEDLVEPYADPVTPGWYGPITLGPDEWFVLGDNRDNSTDSRAWGPVPAENLRGRPGFIWYPWDRFGRVSSRDGP